VEQVCKRLHAKLPLNRVVPAGQGCSDGWGGYIGIYTIYPPNQSTLNFYVVVLSPCNS